MRPLVAFTLLACAAATNADWLISIPTGRKIPFRNIHVETFAELSRARTWERFVGIGITPEFEIDYHGERIGDGAMRDTLDFSYQYISAITDQTPALSIGIQDVFNRTRDGRRGYFAATFRQSMEGLSSPADVTIGVAQARHAMAFVGVSFPLHENFRILVEHNGFRIASGVEFRAFKGALAGRILVRDQDLLVGASLILKF